MAVVYLLYPTSNHNSTPIIILSIPVVYLLYPTSNHNSTRFSKFNEELYIFCILHQTTTYRFKSTDFQCLTITFSNKKWRVGYIS